MSVATFSSLGSASVLRSLIESGMRIARRFWPLALGVLILALPSLVSAARELWSTEEGAHGPIILAAGLWLIIRCHKQVAAVASPGTPLIAAVLLLSSLLLYVGARLLGFLGLEIFSVLTVLGALVYVYGGRAALVVLRFPLAYLLFLVPIPDTVLTALTQPLKLGISEAVATLLGAVGVPIASTGVMLQVAQYELLVAYACSGVSSIFSLWAIGFLYVHLVRNNSWRYAAILMTAALPIALLANLVRVLLLVLITYYLGDAVAQAYLHDFAGLTLMVTAALAFFAADRVLHPIWLHMATRQARAPRP